jgi:hypothetical protein
MHHPSDNRATIQFINSSRIYKSKKSSWDKKKGEPLHNYNGNIRKTKTEKPFLWLSKKIVREYMRDMQPRSIEAYLCIAFCENGTTFRSRISEGRMAEWIGCSKRTVVRAIKELEKMHLIRVYRFNDRVKCNEYELLSVLAPKERAGATFHKLPIKKYPLEAK